MQMFWDFFYNSDKQNVFTCKYNNFQSERNENGQITKLFLHKK